MSTVLDSSQIDPFLFTCQLDAFKKFVEYESGVPFISFPSNPYTEKEEGYKYDVYHSGRDALAFQDWKSSDIGGGDIVDDVIEAIEVPENNLVPWQSRYGDTARPHQVLYVAKDGTDNLDHIERCLFDLYRSNNDEKSFNDLIEIIGRSYPLLAYLFFLKDRSKFLPIAPRSFDRAFEHLGVKFKTSNRCSWENYSTFLRFIAELKRCFSRAWA